MSDNKEIDYGPLTELIGIWEGDKGFDVAPAPNGAENNSYYETITFTASGDVINAESQELAVIHYHQIVKRKSNDKVFHNETGYWMWDAKAGIIMHSLLIPRGVCVLAGGNHNGEKEDNGDIVLKVSAGLKNKDWQIIQSPFMQGNARTMEFHHQITIGSGKLSYAETTIVEIYEKVVEHTDQNELVRQ